MQPKRHDAIIVGAGHNGLVAACYLARAGLDVLVLERNAYVGGAAVSRELHEGFTYSNCSYVCSLLRPEIIRTLELPKYGLQIIPYDGGCTLMRGGGHLAVYSNHDAFRREIARHSKRDAEAYDRYSRDVMRQCKFIKPLLMRMPPDPTSFKPRDLMELLYLGQRFHNLGEERMYDTIRFWTMSAADFLDEYFESDIVKAHFAGSSIIGTALGPRSPGTAYVLLHHYMGDIDDTVGAWGFARGGMGSVSGALAQLAQLLSQMRPAAPGWTLAAAQDIHRQLAALVGARVTARATARIAPRRRRLRDVVAIEDARISHFDLMANAVLSLFRTAVGAIDAGEAIPAELTGAVEELASALARLTEAPQPWPKELLADVTERITRTVASVTPQTPARAPVLAALVRETGRDVLAILPRPAS